jgi:hypothetical protein
MIIQFNTDKTIEVKERYESYFTTKIKQDLKRFQNDISRIEAHISDENGKKDGVNAIRCLLEARIEGKKPISVVDQGNTIELAISGSTAKLKTLLGSMIGKSKNH